MRWLVPHRRLHPRRLLEPDRLVGARARRLRGSTRASRQATGEHDRAHVRKTVGEIAKEAIGGGGEARGPRGAHDRAPEHAAQRLDGGYQLTRLVFPREAEGPSLSLTFRGVEKKLRLPGLGDR